MRCGLLLALTGALLLGCATARRPAAPSLFAAVAPFGFPASVRLLAADARALDTGAAPFWQRLQTAAGNGPVSILALSGGGAGGAFGAGALVGLGRAGARPVFTLVTGVSTGALLAPFAFLGEASDGMLSALFANDRTTHLLRHAGTGLLFHASIYDNRALAELIDRLCSPELIEAVAAQSASGRMLLVATTDLDTQGTVIWDMGAIASQGGEKARALFRSVLLASASYPGLLPPVLIHVEGSGRSYDEMHVDGGTTVPFFIAPGVSEGSPEALEALRGARIYVLLNRQLDTSARTTRVRASSILLRSYSSTSRHFSRTTLELDAERAQRYGMSLLASSIPVDYPLQPFNFEPAVMRALFDYAADCAAAGRLWATPEKLLERGARSLPGLGQAPQCPRSP